MNKRLWGITVLLALSSLSAPLTAKTVYVVEAEPPAYAIEQEPPAEIVEEMPASPGASYIWVRGHWKWEGSWIWVKGHWVEKPLNMSVWVPGCWTHVRHRHWNWTPGHWE